MAVLCVGKEYRSLILNQALCSYHWTLQFLTKQSEEKQETLMNMLSWKGGGMSQISELFEIEYNVRKA